MTKPYDRWGFYGVALVAVFATVTWAWRKSPGNAKVLRPGEVLRLDGAVGRFSFEPASGRIVVASADGRSRLDVDASIVVDGVERPLVMQGFDLLSKDKDAFSIAFALPSADRDPAVVPDDARLTTATFSLHVDPATDALDAHLKMQEPRGEDAHAYALRLSLLPESRVVFVPGVGLLGDLGTATSSSVVFDDDVHPVAFFSDTQALSVTERAPDVEGENAKPRVVVSTEREAESQGDEGDVDAGAPTNDLHIGLTIGASSQAIWARLNDFLRVPSAVVSGVVSGTKERARVVALGDDGHARVRFVVDDRGRFAVSAPMTATTWYAALDNAAGSTPVRFPPGTGYPLKLDVSPGGELVVHVTDADTGRPLIARLLVKGIEGTVDPSFGPDYRASGAGPLMDMLDGSATTPLPAGRYRVSATHGMEWSIDAESITIESGRTKSVELALRHVVPTPGMVGCDLHVHARPSFDAPVTVEDRVLSLASAGIDFAVPSEHNIVGTYAEATEFLGLRGSFAHVTGVEVTTYSPRFGHFGVFPYPLDARVPPFKHTTAAAVFAAAHRGDPNRVVQVNHPRMESGIGYFGIVDFDPKKGRIPSNMATDFDTLEVYNGYESARRDQVERVMEDWFSLLNLGKHYAATGSSDSHRIQYQWAGYPRTFALLDPSDAGDTGNPVDENAVVAALKKGRSFVTSGPILEFSLGASEIHDGPGSEVSGGSGSVSGKLRVRAAPWVDVTSVEIVAGVPATGRESGHDAAGKIVVVFHADVPSRPTYFGKEEGSHEAAEARAVRFESDVTLPLPVGARWVVAVARGDRPMDDALPFMPIQPLAFTNPIWIARGM